MMHESISFINRFSISHLRRKICYCISHKIILTIRVIVFTWIPIYYYYCFYFFILFFMSVILKCRCENCEEHRRCTLCVCRISGLLAQPTCVEKRKTRVALSASADTDLWSLRRTGWIINLPIAMASAAVIGHSRAHALCNARNVSARSCAECISPSRNNNNAPRAAKSMWSSWDPRNESMIDDPADAHH